MYLIKLKHITKSQTGKNLQKTQVFARLSV